MSGTVRICGGDRFPGRRHAQHRQGAGQQARDKTREAGQGTGHGGGRGQRPALFEKDRYAGSLPDFAFDVQPPVVQRGYLAT